MHDTPVAAAAHWAEELAPNEEQHFEQLAREIVELHRASAAQGRALHAKTHAGLRGLLSVPSGLPSRLRHGLFATRGEYRVFLRFSNGSARSEDDRLPDLRGLAIKVLDVTGERVLGPSSPRTQDFLWVDSEVMAFASPDEVVRFMRVASSRSGVLGRLVREFGIMGAFRIATRLARTAKAKPDDLGDLTYYGPAAIRLGPTAARMAAVPVHAKATPQKPGQEADYLGTRLRDRIAHAGLEFELRVQLFSGASTPIEDCTVPWTTDYEPVARLIVPRQGPSAELQEWIENLAFDPWHALVEHRPLGKMMRARKAAYRAMRALRPHVVEASKELWTSFDGSP